ncbi:hypothetical protein XENOCAPTIV_011872 [Xenoophorus captivus]|uniref:Uncharacterized protein n=1 Tax=Xenoophorus captivus TaxID=1517983 RepID=A0ABV0S1Y1_9TELE
MEVSGWRRPQKTPWAPTPVCLTTPWAPAHTLLAVSTYCPLRPLLMCPGNQVMMAGLSRHSLCGTVQCECS